MHTATRSGLIASPRKHVTRVKKSVDVNSLLPCAFTRPAPFSLKPYAGVFNPYSKGCSVLCNHPTKNLWHEDGGKPSVRYKHEKHQNHEHDIPEDFYRRFTDTDSRPLTPTPSCATSARTRTNCGMGSHLSVRRRCVTPEPVGSDGHERKQIILDLRRSHSQETLCWNASSEISSSWVQSQTTKHDIEITDAAHKEDIEEIEEEEENEDGQHINSEDVGDDIINEVDYGNPLATCINACDIDDDESDLRRRGKRRKKSKSNMQIITFQPSNEPETQVEVAKLDPDSPNISHRPSLVPDSSNTITPMLSKAIRKTDDFYDVSKSLLFLDDDLKNLRYGLDVETVECVFDRYRHRTLQEVLRTISPDRMGTDSDAVREMKDALNLYEIDHEKWMHLPRKYTRSSTRFELPIDLKELVKLNPITYLSKFVFVEDDKKQLYHRIFTKYLPKDKTNRDENDNDDFFTRANNEPNVKDELIARCLPRGTLKEALKEVLSFHATDKKIEEIRCFLSTDEELEEISIDFRTFCGIVAFSERLITTLDQNDDPRNEIEVADFETLARHYDKIEDENMRRLFDIIQK